MHSIVGIFIKKKNCGVGFITLTNPTALFKFGGTRSPKFWPHIKFENDLVFEIILKTENTYHVSTLRLATIHTASAQLRSDFDYSPAPQKSLSPAHT